MVHKPAHADPLRGARRIPREDSRHIAYAIVGRCGSYAGALDQIINRINNGQGRKVHKARLRKEGAKPILDKLIETMLSGKPVKGLSNSEVREALAHLGDFGDPDLLIDALARVAVALDTI